MAKKLTDGTQSGAELVKKDQNTALSSIPDFMRDDMNEGKEGIDISRIKMPRLGIAQGLSHAMIPGDSAYIDGLRMFEMYNATTDEIYGMGPILFIAIQYRVVIIEFDPKDRNKILDNNVPANDPRTQWRPNPDDPKKDLPPLATTFNEAGVLLIREGRPPEPIVISIKMTNKHNVRAGDRLTMFINNTPGPIYGSLKSIGSKSEKNDRGSFGVPVIQNIRMLGKVGGPLSPNLEGDALSEDTSLYLYAKQFYTSIQGKIIDTDRVADEGEETGGGAGDSGM